MLGAANRNQVYEDRLNSLNLVEGANWTYVNEIPLTEIEQHQESQARIRTASKARVNEYTEKLNRGESFPPIVVWSTDEGQYLLDGNTRTAAWLLARRTHIHGYVIHFGIANTDNAKYVSAQFNLLNGVPLDSEEKVTAIEAALRITNPPTQITLAKQFGISTSRINQIASSMAFTARAAALGLNIVGTPEAVKKHLARVKDDAVIRALTDLANDAHMLSKDVGSLVNLVNAAGSEAERMKIVSDARIDLAEEIEMIKAGRQTNDAAPSRESHMVFGRMLSLKTKFPNPYEWVPRRDDAREEWLPKVAELRDFLDRVAAAYAVPS